MDKIYDSIFRTLCEKNPELLIPLVNEFFGENFSLNENIQLLAGEHHVIPDEYSEIITDSSIRINNRLYHIECQSNPDDEMIVRMIEYDFYIALEHVEKKNDGYLMHFPKSVVIYLRHTKNTPNELKMSIQFQNGEIAQYTVPIIKMGEITVKRIIEKEMYFLVPYYLLRYEKLVNKKEFNQMKTEYELLYKGLSEAYNNKKIDLEACNNIADMTNRLLEHVYPKNEVSREVQRMGGEVLVTQYDITYEKGRKEGRKEGKLEGKAESTEMLSSAITLIVQGFDTVDKLIEHGVSEDIAIDALKIYKTVKEN